MPSDLESRYMSLDDEQLARIAHSEDYRPEARHLARALLLRRNISEEAIDAWRDPTAEFASAPWASGKSESDLRRMFRRRQFLGQFDRVLILLPIILAILSQLTRPAPFSLVRFCYYFIWYLLLLRFFLHCIFYWRSPLQILLLRPFEFPQSRKRTRRFARTYLRYLGHTYTISDAEVKPRRAFLESLQFLLPFFLPWIISLWMYWVFRPYFKVRHDKDIPNLKEFINRRFARNMAWALSWDKLFKISCKPQCWQRVIQHLINSSQLIVVDLSHAGDGLRWELDEVRFYRANMKIVFVCYQESLDSARTFVESFESEAGRGHEVFMYGDNGQASRHEELSRILVSVAASSLATNESIEVAA